MASAEAVRRHIGPMRRAATALACAAGLAARTASGAEGGGAESAAPATPASDPNSKVLTLDSSNWSTVMEDPETLLMVEFYAPWCGHCKNLAPAYEQAASSLHEKHPSRPLLAKIDATTNMAIGRRYNVLSYPSLLLFAKGVDGDVWDIPAAPNVMPVLETVMLRYATQPAELNAKRKVWADKAARMASLMVMDGTNYDANLAEMRGMSVLVFLHARFCKECSGLLEEMSKAARTLVKEGYPRGVVAAIDTGTGGSGGSAPRKFARPCPDCPACGGYPCFKLMEVDAEGVPHHRMSYVAAQLRNGRAMADAIRNQLTGQGVTPQAATAAWLSTQVRMVYKEHNAEKLGGVPALLEKYKAGLHLLLDSVKKKYELPADVSVGTHLARLEQQRLVRHLELSNRPAPPSHTHTHRLTPPGYRRLCARC